MVAMTADTSCVYALLIDSKNEKYLPGKVEKYSYEANIKANNMSFTLPVQESRPKTSATIRKGFVGFFTLNFTHKNS